MGTHNGGRPATANATLATPDDSGLRVIICVAFNRGAPPEQISALKNAVVACPSTLHAVEVTGTFDFLIELAVPDIATFNERLDFVAPSVAKVVERYEVNFVVEIGIVDAARHLGWSGDDQRHVISSRVVP